MSPIPRNTSLRRTLPRAGLIMVTSLALIAGLYGPAAQATPVAVAKDPDWTPAKLKSVPVKEAATKPAPIDAGAKLDVTRTPTVVWPGAGTADAVPVADGDPRVTPAPTQRGPLTATELAKGKAGDLPVWVGVPRGRALGAEKVPSASVPSKVRVQSLGRQGNQLVLKVGRSDGVRAAGRAELRVNYEQFRHTFGGDWALRLRLYKAPDCLASKAPAAGCVLEELPTVNDGSGELAADVPVAADGATPGTFVVQAAAASGGGDYKATSLKPSATWTVGGSAGDFNWSYPLKSPPGLGGPVPQVDINYSSGGVDGRTAATNNQPSWVGEGFEFSPGGSIERKYASCASKSEKTGNNGSAITGDMCYATDNATFTLNGKGGELVLDDTTKKWHPRNDDGSTIERINDTTKENGDNDGEYWLLTSKDGTKYYFGLNKVTGYDAAPVKETTNSTYTVPVFGNHGGEPCNKATFATSWCDQAYKWNLDYVVDRNGNTMTLFYDKEDNFYGRNATKTTVSKYTRAGNVKRIEYGQRDGAVLTSEPVAQVLFTTVPRCVPGTACTTADYPDTPLDQECTSSTSCEKFNPTFWTKKRLVKISTQVWRASENKFTDVEAWNLRQSFRDPGDNTKPGLWLDAISEEGLVGAPLAMPEVNFDSIQLANRVDPVGDAQPPMNWLRVNTVTYGSGGVIKVDYSPQDCKPGDVPAPDTNGRRCHPMKWTPTNDTERTDWFHKYVVAKVTESDRFLSTEPVVTEVQYLSPPAWRHDDEDGLVEIGAKTWSSWRGYDRVKVIKGHPDAGTQSVTESRYFRGMDGDKLAGGGVKDVKITDSEGTQVEDLLPLAGQLREQTTYNGSEIVDRTINDQWVSAPTGTRVKPWATTSSFQVEQAGNKQVQTVAGGALRTQAANNIYDAEGVLLAKNDVNNVADPSDDKCTKYEYVKNDALGIQEIVKRELTLSVACDKPFSKDQVVADKRTYYDGATSVDAVPTKGNPTKTERVSGFDASGNPIYEVQSTMSYDALGRPTRSTDAKGGVSTTTYTPAGAGPVTQVSSTKPNGHTTSKEVEPAWGEDLVVTDAAGRRTEATYDALGRTTKVWTAGRAGTAQLSSKVAGQAYTADNAAIPNMEYEYHIGEGNAASVVISKTLQSDGSVAVGYELSDGMLRPRQQQEPAPGGGRTITETRYDSRGLAIKQYGSYYNDQPVTETVAEPVEDAIPTKKLISFDGAERPVEETFVSGTTVRWTTKHKNSADQQTVEPPKGQQPTTKVTDAQGRLTELRQFTGTTATGSYDKTSYKYDAAGRPLLITDPAGNQWTWEYDVRGRKVKEIDPDKGTTVFTYNELDQMTSTVDARGAKLEFTYDTIGRRTAVHQVAATGEKTLLSDWKYDDVPVVGQPGATAKGSPSTSTRYVDGKAYVTKITGYDPSGKPLGTEVTLPDSEGALAGTYKFASTYKADGEIASSTVPAVGGLPQETLQYGYNDKDLPTTLSSELTSYVRSTSYTAFGEVSGLTVGATGGKSVSHVYDYEAGTRRLTRVTTSKEVAPARISDVRYSYDDAGNIIKITDAPSTTTGEPTDNQCFAYDHLRRLTGAWTPANGDCAAAPNKDTLGGPAPYWHSWTFDLTGNRKSETRTSASGSTTATYAYPAAGQARPHAVQSVTTTGTGGTKTDTYQYDVSGNLTGRNLNGTAETFTWDGENELSEVTGGGKTTKYLNNADGDRLIRRDASGVTLYLPGDTEVLLKPDGSLQGTRYYKHGEQTVAVRVGANQLSWLGADHHGTTTTAIDNTAQQNVQRRRLDPYGNIRGTAPTAWPGQRGFVGGTNDASTGLVHLGAREYDPTTGRFISVDPEANYQDPQTINGYSYSNNSPVTFTDPDGNSWFSNMVSSVTSSIKSVAETVVTRTVETVRSVVNTVTPVVNWVRDKVTQGLEAVRTFVHTVKEEIKKVVKTVAKVVVKKIQTFVKKVQVVAKKIASAAKTVAKAVVKNVKTAVKAVGDAASAVGRGIKTFVQSELGKTILHAAASIATTFLASAAAVALCGPAALVCAAVGSAAFGGIIGGALHTGVDALTGDKISMSSIGGHVTSSMMSSGVGGLQRSVGATWVDVSKTVFRGGWKKLGDNVMKLGDTKNWRLPGMEPTKFLPK